MSNTLLRTLAATTVVVACARSDAAPRAKDSTPATATAASSATSSAAAASGTTAPHDSTTDRADRGRILGDSTAPLWVIMASDFQCPYCKQWHDADFQKIVDKYVKTGKVRLAFLNMPLNMHQHAMVASEAAMCASVQNKFWPVHESMFSGQQQWESLPDPMPMFSSYAGQAGVNMDEWRKCMKDHLTLPLIQADHDRVVAAHVNSTPTFFVGDRVLPGADAKLADAIDAALATSAKKPTS